MKRSIGVFDSGIGGLTILDELKKVLPHESFIYYKDSKNNPYGEKAEKEIYDIVKGIVEYLISLDVKLIVIACNTATTRCMKKLRKEFPQMIFVGTVPAIKVATDNGFKNTLVMATPSTITSERTNELIHDNKKENHQIRLLECYGLANAIEKNDNDLIHNILTNIFKDYVNEDIDSIVLGCTHYPLIKDKINEIFPRALLIDSAPGVAKEVKNQLIKNNIYNEVGEQSIRIIDSENI